MLKRLLFVTFVATALCGVVGCGKRGTTVTGPGGEKATVETDRGGGKTTVKIRSDEGDAKIEISEDVDLSDLGIEVYPGAKAETGGTYRTEEMEEDAVRSVSLTTSDSFEDVAGFYKDKYGEGAQAVMEQPGSLMIMCEEEDKDLTIVVTRDEGDDETTIAITTVPKNG